MFFTCYILLQKYSHSIVLYYRILKMYVMLQKYSRSMLQNLNVYVMVQKIYIWFDMSLICSYTEFEGMIIL